MTTTHGFELLRDEQIPEFNARAHLYRHAKTGAQSQDEKEEGK